MKYIYTLLVALSFSYMQAQNADTKKADKHFDRYEFLEAIEDYEKLIEKGKADTYVYAQLAEANYNIYDTKAAETYYAKVVKDGNATNEQLFRYAQMLKANNKYEKSNEVMMQFAKNAPNDDRAITFLENPNYVPKLLGSEEKFTLEAIEMLNSEYSDFGGAVSGNTLYFVSARNKSRKKYGWNEQPTLDIYKADIIEGTYKEPELVKGEVNTKYNEGSVAISSDGNRMYFTRNQYLDGKYGKDENGVGQLQLYFAENVNGTWKDVKSVPFNNSEYSIGHPALSKDGKTLYFVSDMPGGQGQSDIYMVEVTSNGFGTPKNLGANINTAGRENFPHVDEDGTLYFSSDGHLGLGGLDVFYASNNNGQYGKAKNIGTPVNSKGDDFAFTLNLESGNGYVSSNRGKALVDNIYGVTLIEPLCEVQLAVKVVDDKTNNAISNANVDLYDDKENKVTTVVTDANGMTNFTVQCEQAYQAQVNIDDYESNSVTMAATKDATKELTVRLKPIEAIVTEDRVILNPILFDYDKSNIKPQAAFELDKLVQVMNKYPEMEIFVESHTDNKGPNDYNMSLSERRAKSTVQYVVSKGIAKERISGKGFGESKPAVECGENCSDEQRQTNRRSEFVIIKK